MSIFKEGRTGIEARNSETVIGHDSYFQGTFTIKGSLKVEGRIDGSIVDGKIVTVGKAGKVKGDISCENAVVHGEVRGNIVATKGIEILAGGNVEGDLNAPKITLEDGCLFNGRCTMAKRESHIEENIQPTEKKVKSK